MSYWFPHIQVLLSFCFAFILLKFWFLVLINHKPPHQGKHVCCWLIYNQFRFLCCRHGRAFTLYGFGYFPSSLTSNKCLNFYSEVQKSRPLAQLVFEIWAKKWSQKMSNFKVGGYIMVTLIERNTNISTFAVNLFSSCRIWNIG